MKKIQIFLYQNRSIVFGALLMALILTLADSSFAQGLTPQANPFGARGDQAIGGFGSTVLTILNAFFFYGGCLSIGKLFYNVAFGSGEWVMPGIGTVIGFGGWTGIGAVAWQMGNNQAFQIPMIT